jgi:phage gpG-like protein
MTSLRVEFSINEAEDLIRGLEGRLTDLTPAMAAIGEYMLVRTRERFDGGVAPDGTVWQPLASETIASKRRRKTKPGKRARVRAAPTDILKESFLLRDTIAYQAESTLVRVGTSQEYGVYHQSDEPRSKLPRRAFLGVNAEDLVEIDEIVTNYLRF